jgi:hypothetical protein
LIVTWLVCASSATAQTTEAKLTIATGRLPNGPRTKRNLPETLTSFFGLRPTETRVSGRDPFGGLTLAIESLGYFQDPKAHVSGRVSHFGMLGLTRHGVEGGLGADFMVGLFTPLEKRGGFVSRLGGRGHLLGNHAFYTSLLELPMLELGYQHLEKDFRLDVAGHGGGVLVGRYKPDGEQRRLGGSFEYGGLFSFRAGPVDFDLDWTHVAAESGPGTAIDMLRSLLCGGANFFGVCMDARWSSGEVNSGERKTITYMGLAVGGLAR